MSLSLIGVLPASASPPPEPSPYAQKTAGAVREQLASEDRVTFWVQLGEQADTSAARKERKKADRGRAVIAAKKAEAGRSQAGVVSLLKKAGARYTSYWIANTLKVTGDRDLARKIAARPEVASIEEDKALVLPHATTGGRVSTVDGVEWNIDRINAPKVWNGLGKHGEGVVVANIDSGVDYRHPALAANYRGHRADGTVDNAYNWFDPADECTGDDPCDNDGHGTHTMGTMVGDDGTGNAVGAAPGATWIAAKACEDDGCPRDALLAAGQWILAPTDAAGADPRPDLAPDVVNNSWGTTTLDLWYKATVQAWRDAGIFASFSNGNTGPDCVTTGSPGGYDNAYASGAFDSDGDIADFSSRGAGEGSGIKPDIAAPGVDIRSAWPGGGYQSLNGTSMAAPHTAATVALMWSASPAIRGDVAETERLLDSTAVDTFDPACGGTAANNNVWGEGKLDAYAAVMATPRGPLGTLSGTVTADGKPLAGATVRLDGPMRASVRTADDGTYALDKVTAGDYTVSVSRYGYLTDRAAVTVVANTGVTRNADLKTAPTGTVTGTVRVKGGPAAGAKLEVSGTPVSLTTAADGRYALELPLGDYQLAITPGDKCARAVVFTLAVAAEPSARDLDLPLRTDGYGTTCQVVADAPYPTGEVKLPLSGAAGGTPVNLPFPVALYGRTYTAANVTVEGVLAFGPSSTTSINEELPYTGTPNGALYPFWDNFLMDSSSGVYTAFRGTAPHREFVVEWRDMVLSDSKPQRVSFAAVLSEDGGYTFHYKDIGDGAAERGSSATVGAENHDGTDAFQYSCDETALHDGMTIAFRPAKSASVAGTVTDANDGKALAGAEVTVSRDGATVGTGTSGADGQYLVQVPAAEKDAYEVRVGASHYETATRSAALGGGDVSRADSALRTGLVTASPDEGWRLVVPAGERRTRAFTLANAGLAADYTVGEKDGAGWLTAAPATGSLATGGTRKVTVTFDASDATPGTVLRGTLRVASRSGRAPVLDLPVVVAVPAYRTAVDAGSATAVTDTAGDLWAPDRAYTEGSYGYLGRKGTVTTRKTIANTDEQQLFSSAAKGAYEYRFDGLPEGVYEVELGFAELSSTQPGRRLFDVLAEGVQEVPDVDIALEAGGPYRALSKTFTVRVGDGQLNLRFASPADQPVVNAIRVTHRPDLG
ncbi:S8 family serine peptidase [Streptomyces sp. 130]|uniref:S8 family serine peptidase n=1 Tax=Streptomyces sp. 130 TaxID=2591006 RepID=UPI00117D1C8F|nr:S8 family serine peptidase [Streptomyces sp. 130]TRV80795.1 S8 family serine peptidase [Streptomyces sp. 130]